MNLDRAKLFLSGRRRAYRVIFDGPTGKEVLADLAKFCRANASTYHTDDKRSNMLEGRREVFLRIQQHLNLTDQELWDLLDGRK